MTVSMIEVISYEIKTETHIDALRVMSSDDFDPEDSELVEDFRTLEVMAERQYYERKKWGIVGKHEKKIIDAKIDEFEKVTGAEYTPGQRKTFFLNMLTSYRDNGYLPTIASVPQ